MATERWIHAGKSVIFASVVNLLGIGIIILAMIPFVRMESQYSLSDTIKIMLDGDAKAMVTYNKDARSIVLSGPLGFGTTKRLTALLEQHPDVRGIQLKSYGGRVVEGLAINELITAHNLGTYVHDECMSACVTAFMAGNRRYVAGTARFGLHRSGYTWIEDDVAWSVEDEIEATKMRHKNISEDFIKKGMANGLHGIYEPTVEEVMSSGLGTELVP